MKKHFANHVPQVSNLLYRRFPNLRCSAHADDLPTSKSAIQQAWKPAARVKVLGLGSSAFLAGHRVLSAPREIPIPNRDRIARLMNS